MLTTLNTIMNEDYSRVAGDWILWRDINGPDAVNIIQLQHELAVLRHKINAHKAPRWLLYAEDQHYFLLGLLALLGLKKKVIISASKKPDWLGNLSAEFDAILSDEDLRIVGERTGEKIERSCVNFELPGVQPDSWRPCYDGHEELVFFTSGSTGAPKAIVKKFQALINEVNTLGKVFPDSLHESLFISSVSHLHIYGLIFNSLLPLFMKGCSINRRIGYPEQLCKLAEKSNNAAGYDRKVFITSPSFLNHIDPALPHVEMKVIFSSGGPLSFPAAKNANKYFNKLPIEVYGSTETGGIGYRQQMEESSAWRMFPGVELFMRETGVEILSPNMPDGTGYMIDDRLELLPDNRFMLKGRKDRIIKIAEKRISLTEIEQFLELQTTIRQCVALLISGKREILACAVVLNESGENIAAETGYPSLIKGWKKAMQDRFEAVIIPKKWRILKEIPVNSQSKIDHYLLLAAFNPGHQSH